MERIVKKLVMAHIVDTDVLSVKKYRFIPGRSTTSQFLTYLDLDCIACIVNGEVVDSVYLVYAKAFRTASRQRLINKISAYG